MEEDWRLFSNWTDLYKFFINAIIRLNVFHYAVTGAIVSYYFAHRTEPLMHYSLLLPIIMSGAFCWFFFKGVKFMAVTIAEVNTLCGRLNTKLDFVLIQNLLQIFGWLFFVLAAALVALFLLGLCGSTCNVAG